MNANTWNYPKTEQITDTYMLHDTPIHDPYSWLEKVDESVNDWVDKQNNFTQSYLASANIRGQIRETISPLARYPHMGIPQKRVEQLYFLFNDGRQNVSKLVRGNLFGEETIDIVDPNTLSKDGTICVSNWEISPDGTYLVYALSSSGSDWQTLHIKNLVSDSKKNEQIPWVKFSSIAFLPSSVGFFYTCYDKPEKGQEYKQISGGQSIQYHEIGTDPIKDIIIYQTPVEKKCYVDATVTLDGHYLILTLSPGATPENALYFIDLEDKKYTLQKLIDTFDATYEFIGNQGTLFYLRTNKDAPQYKIICCDCTATLESARDVIAETGDTCLQSVYFDGRILFVHQHNAFHCLKSYSLKENRFREVPVPPFGSIMDIGHCDKEGNCYCAFTSFTQPPSIYHYSMVSNKLDIVFKPSIPWNTDEYVTKQMYYSSKDGTKIPLNVIYHRSIKPSEQTPLCLYGYGGFDISLTPSFSLLLNSWVAFGGIYAVANLRGGGEFGESWHQSGKKELKQNVFDDFIAAAEYLVEKKFTSKKRLVISGRSNGGLLTGACLTQRPDLFGACIVSVGVLDMLKYHKFTSGWGWIPEYGDPDNKEDFKVLYAYSPYHKLTDPLVLPPTLITTGDHDDRVYPAHSYKFAARMQHLQMADNPILLRVDHNAGHGAFTPQEKIIDESVDILTFIFKEFSITQEQLAMVIV